MPGPKTHSFEFVDDITGFRAPSQMLVRLTGRLRRKQDLLRALAAGLKFPNYFGYNWDALEECLRDLSWLDAPRGIVLLHENLPLTDDSQRAIYLDILRTAQRAHEFPLYVVFPHSSQAQLEPR